ncbi:MAG: GAF domain-containing sensor histidine kinase [Anaerolineae bacterium]
MDAVSEFLTANIIFVYFFYGLAFFAMGLAVALESGRGSEFRFAQATRLLAWFGLLHGSHEWLEMFQKIAEQTSGQIFPPLAEAARVILLALSFLLLIAFGARLTYGKGESQRRVYGLISILGLVWLGGVVGIHLFLNPGIVDLIAASEVWARYSLGMPGAVLAAWALVLEWLAFRERGMPRFGRYLLLTAIAFSWYGVVGQLFTRQSILFPSTIINDVLFVRLAGMPVQLFRAIMAGLMAVFVIHALRAFELEGTRRLEAARREAFEIQRRMRLETEQLNEELRAAARDLSVLFEMSRMLASTLDLDALLQEAITKIVQMLEPVQSGMILLYEGEARALAPMASCGYGPNPADSENFDLSQRVGIRAVQIGQTVWHRGDGKLVGEKAEILVVEQGGEVAKQGPSDKVATTVAVPVISKSGIVGSLVLGGPYGVPSFAASDVPLIEALAGQLGMTIENARLYKDVKLRDELRGQLLYRAVSAQEEERRRIGRELHDETGQALTALGVGLRGVEETLLLDPDLARTQLAELRDLSVQALEELRQLISDLRPSLLDDLGLVAAVRSYAKRFGQNFSLDVQVEISGDRRRLPAQIEIVVFRIVQEGLTNVGRHAKAQKVLVSLNFGPSVVTLTVEDDGAGFNPDEVLGPQTKRRGWGLLGIKERIALVGGKFSIQSSPGMGTKLVAEIPIGG